MQCFVRTVSKMHFISQRNPRYLLDFYWGSKVMKIMVALRLWNMDSVAYLESMNGTKLRSTFEHVNHRALKMTSSDTNCDEQDLFSGWRINDFQSKSHISNSKKGQKEGVAKEKAKHSPCCLLLSYKNVLFLPIQVTTHTHIYIYACFFFFVLFLLP